MIKLRKHQLCWEAEVLKENKSLAKHGSSSKRKQGIKNLSNALILKNISAINIINQTTTRNLSPRQKGLTASVRMMKSGEKWGSFIKPTQNIKWINSSSLSPSSKKKTPHIGPKFPSSTKHQCKGKQTIYNKFAEDTEK